MRRIFVLSLIAISSMFSVTAQNISDNAIGLRLGDSDGLGAEVSYSDPHVPVFPQMREHHFDLSSVDLSAEVLQSYDCVLMATDHAKFDYDMILQNAELLIDTRGKFDPSKTNVVRA